MGPEFVLLIFAGFVGFGTFVVGILNSRNAAFEKARDDRFREADALADNALQEATHLRQRILEVRAERDELRAQLREEQAKVERRDIRIAQLEEKIRLLEAKERAYRRLMQHRGINEADVDDG